MARYAVLIYDDPEVAAQTTEAQFDAVMAQHEKFEQEHPAAFVDSFRLRSADTATTLRRDRGSVTVTDGAFAETREMLGGFYLIEAADLDEALRLAEQIPSVGGGVEVRPLWPDPR